MAGKERSEIDNVITGLIDLDKQARARVEKAKKAKVQTVAQLDAKRTQLTEEKAKEFSDAIEKLKSQKQQELERLQKQIAEKKADALARLDEKRDKNIDRWKEEIVKEVTTP